MASTRRPQRASSQASGGGSWDPPPPWRRKGPEKRPQVGVALSSLHHDLGVAVGHVGQVADQVTLVHAPLRCISHHSPRVLGGSSG